MQQLSHKALLESQLRRALASVCIALKSRQDQRWLFHDYAANLIEVSQECGIAESNWLLLS